MAEYFIDKPLLVVGFGLHLIEKQCVVGRVVGPQKRDMELGVDATFL